MAFDEKKCMECDPFEGDFGDGERILKDKIVTARKDGPCHMCGQEIKPGTRIRIRTEACEGELTTFRWCSECCAAMAINLEDEGEALEARINLHPNQQARYAE